MKTGDPPLGSWKTRMYIADSQDADSKPHVKTVMGEIMPMIRQRHA